MNNRDPKSCKLVKEDIFYVIRFQQLQQAKVQQNQAEEERLANAHARNRSSLERGNMKASRRHRSSSEGSSPSEPQVAALLASQEQEVDGRDFRMTYYCPHYLFARTGELC